MPWASLKGNHIITFAAMVRCKLITANVVSLIAPSLKLTAISRRELEAYDGFLV